MTASECVSCRGDGQVCNRCFLDGRRCKCPESALPTPIRCTKCKSPMQRVRLSVVAEVVREWIEQLGNSNAHPPLDETVISQVLAASGDPKHGLVKFLDRRLRELDELDEIEK